MQHTDTSISGKHERSAAASNEEVKRLLLIDDHPIMRHGLAQLVSVEAGLQVCGECGTAREGMEAVTRLKPDLIVIDLTLPDKHGLELLKDLHAMFPGLLCLVLSMHDEQLYGERALRAGARGYLMKEVAAEQFINAVRKILSGGIYVSDTLAGQMLELAVGAHPKRGRTAAVDQLTDRELEVLQWIGSGKPTKWIAEQMSISTRTVEAHRSHIKEKLGIADGAALVRYAVQWLESRS